MQIVMLAGNVGKDATIRSLPNGDKVLSFSVAVDNGKDKESTWYDCSLFGKRGEALRNQVLVRRKQVVGQGFGVGKDQQRQGACTHKKATFGLHAVGILHGGGDEQEQAVVALRCFRD